jgi:hypothetical protein
MPFRDAKLSAFLLPALLGEDNLGPAPGGLGKERPHPDMTRAETLEYLRQLPEEKRQQIAGSPDGRIDKEELYDFRVRMKLKNYVEHTL